MEAATLANSGAGDMANRSYTTFEVWTEPARHQPGYVSWWAAPGHHPGIVKDPKTKDVQVFDNQAIAEIFGWRRMAEALNRPRVLASKGQGKPERYRKMSHLEFSQELADVELTPTFFAYLYGTSPKRVIDWIDGVEDVPHPVRLMLALFKDDPKNIDIIESLTNSVTTIRQPRKPAA